MNIERHNAVIAEIKAHPEQWDQTDFYSACGTKHCYGGWAQVHAGKSPDETLAWRDARQWLELTASEANYLFNWDRTLAQLEAANVPHGYEEFGDWEPALLGSEYNTEGFNRFGYDADGYDTDGLNAQFELRPGVTP